MTEVTNKQRLRAIFGDLARGEGGPFVDAMAEDFSWTVIGTTPWSGSYRGKESVRHDLFAPLLAQFADRYTNTAERILSDGDFVVVECRGSVRTETGKRYDNTYCYIIRMADGLMKELTEYCDTALIESALAPPPQPVR